MRGLEEKYLSLAEAAGKIGVSRDYLRFLIFKNKLRGKKFGRNWVYHQDLASRVLPGEEYSKCWR